MRCAANEGDAVGMGSSLHDWQEACRIFAQDSKKLTEARIGLEDSSELPMMTVSVKLMKAKEFAARFDGARKEV
jgi:hypothetical protein